jgi:hypothetical protein
MDDLKVFQEGNLLFSDRRRSSSSISTPSPILHIPSKHFNRPQKEKVCSVMSSSCPIAGCSSQGNRTPARIRKRSANKQVHDARQVAQTREVTGPRDGAKIKDLSRAEKSSDKPARDHSLNGLKNRTERVGFNWQTKCRICGVVVCQLDQAGAKNPLACILRPLFHLPRALKRG